ncbi:alanine racemase [Erythrobacter sp. SDW2]|uniref:alanine racemase n=1 Tax=Erythrobacter sp. SDW2 TaxID=2907154 RepID=UPI001F3E91FB|nr:alanine racemase [Erythrobacter sp. SDW2]UIP05780.1 alanine racemase [Erythrobacter sp. SDW2]
MVPPPPPTLRLNVDREALTANWRALDRLSGRARAGAAVKADCYGLGVDACVPALRDAGARDFFIAHWSEVAEVLKHVPPEQVSVLHGANSAEEAAYARATGVRPVINSIHQAQVWTEAGGGPCHLMVDTGIHRLGIRPEEASDPAIAALDIEVLMSHLSSADEDSLANAAQLSSLLAVRDKVQVKEVSLSNSAGIGLGVDYALDLTRPGLALYGGIPRPELAGQVRQVAYLQAALIQVAELLAGESVGYNREFTAPAQTRVGTVSLGYADGFLRAWGGKGRALESQGRKLPILGKVSMDMIVVDLAAAPDLKVGDWLDVPYSLPEGSAVTGLSQYELLTILGRRLRG